MASHSLGLTLYDAARQMGVPFVQENEAADKVIQLDGMNFHYLEWGNSANPLILMLHGNSQQAHSWDFVNLALSNHYHSIVLDQRGHGDSDWAPDGDYSVEAQQKDLDAFVQALGLDNFNLIGHSMGGAQCLRVGVPPPQYAEVVGNCRHWPGYSTDGSGQDAAVPRVAG